MYLYRFMSGCLIAALLLGSSVHGKVMPVEFDAGRNRLIAYMLSHQLPAQHFSHKPFDNQMSRSAYDLYLKQLDPRKQFLLRNDAQRLKKFSEKIDDEINNGRIALPDIGMQLLNKQANEVERLVEQLLDTGFDPNRVDYLQTDPEKIGNPVDINELKDRWRRSLKLEVLDTYLEALEKENKELKKDKKELLNIDSGPVDQKIWKDAVEKVRKKTLHYLDRLRKTTRQEYYNRYFDSISRAFDPHTTYMAPTSKEDFDIGGKIIFVIEPKCTLEEIPLMFKYRSGVLTVEPWKC